MIDPPERRRSEEGRFAIWGDFGRQLTLFPRRYSGRDGDMRMVALRRSVHRGEW